MQFQVVCRHCHRPSMIESKGGNMLRYSCLYCGESMMIIAPQMGAPSDSTAETTATADHVQVEKGNT